MTVKVKICGITDAASFDAAIDAGADWVGFVFFPASPRFVTPAQAAALSARLPGGPQRVGLFVDPTPEGIKATLDVMRLDCLQLYGAVDFLALHSRIGLPIWRPVAVGGESDLPASACGADRLIMEARAPSGATRPGGNAVRFDWSLLRAWRAPAPWILAGGLTANNVSEAIRATGARAVDVSSGVEQAPGTKDPALIRAFIANARSAGPRLRRATPADAQALGRTHVAAWREAYAGLVPDAVLAALDPEERAVMWRGALAKDTTAHVVELGDAIVGFSSGGPQRDPSIPCSGEIYAIYVLQAAQRQGLGRALMSAIAADLVARGHGSAMLWVIEDNRNARRFYQALGGREIARREQQREGVSATGIAYAWDDLRTLV